MSEKPIKVYPIDDKSVRINTPDPTKPDLMVRRLADGSLKAYEQHKPGSRKSS